MTTPRLNLNEMFKETGWPKSEKASANALGKQLRPGQIRGMNYVPNRNFWIGTPRNRNVQVLRNKNLRDLPDGVWLYLIEYDTNDKKYYKQFVKINSRMELEGKHFHLPTPPANHSRVVLAAGELVKTTSKLSGEINIVWNIQSGTFTKEFINKGYGNADKFRRIVLNAFHNTGLVNSYKYNNRNLLEVYAPPAKLRKVIGAMKEGRLVYNNDPFILRHLERKHKKREEAGLTTINEEKPNVPGNTPQSKRIKKNNNVQ
jgi:hypothetical protein